jgi:hypothetical protein
MGTGVVVAAAGVVDEDEAGFRVMLLLIVTKLVEITDFDMLATLVDVIGIKDEIAVVLVDDVTGTVGRAVVISETWVALVDCIILICVVGSTATNVGADRTEKELPGTWVTGVATVIGQTVVYRMLVIVTTFPIGQFVTVVGQAVTVDRYVVYIVEVVNCAVVVGAMVVVTGQTVV